MRAAGSRSRCPRIPPTGSRSCARGTASFACTRGSRDVAHAYTPGLRVTEHAVVRRERRLPLKGEVRVARGERVEADTVVARTELPGNVHTVNLASRLAVD